MDRSDFSTPRYQDIDVGIYNGTTLIRADQLKPLTTVNNFPKNIYKAAEQMKDIHIVNKNVIIDWNYKYASRKFETKYPDILRQVNRSKIDFGINEIHVKFPDGTIKIL